MKKTKEIAAAFVDRYLEEIKHNLDLQTFDKNDAVACACKFLDDNAEFIQDRFGVIDEFLMNSQIATVIIAFMYKELVSKKVRESRRRVQYVSRLLEQKESGKLPGELYNQFLKDYVSGTVNTKDFEKTNDLNTLSLARASERLNYNRF